MEIRIIRLFTKFLVRATDFIERSTTVESTSIRPSSRKAASQRRCAVACHYCGGADH
ncbi:MULTISPECIES: hypothetical protein [Ensifer]|jgi:hypothetical protein|uniref:hypothetical protein n=1 Tax=Ensifer TaxID=106591 RepID=UPI0023EAC1A6|nr:MULTISPECIES: hypothetical protein [Ensifer]